MTSILEKALTDGRIGNPNMLIDGKFDFWFEGTSHSSTGYGSATMWKLWMNQATGSLSQQEFAQAQTDVPNNPTYFARSDFTSVSNVSEYFTLLQNIEGVEQNSDKKVTLSFYAKADAPITIATEFRQDFGTGGTPSDNVTGIGVEHYDLTTSWQKFQTTVSIPSISGKSLGTDNNDKLVVAFWFTQGGDYSDRGLTVGTQSGIIDIANVKLEEGSVTTEGGWLSTDQEYLRTCRYYLKSTKLGITETNSGRWMFYYEYPTEMRVSPTISWSSTYYCTPQGAYHQSARRLSLWASNVSVATSTGHTVAYAVVTADARL